MYQAFYDNARLSDNVCSVRVVTLLWKSLVISMK